MNKKYYVVYKITNLINNKIYIGAHSTNNLDDSYMGSGKHLKRAENKYGITNFIKEILFIFDNKEEMLLKELELVNEEFIKRTDTYNIIVGGTFNTSGFVTVFDENNVISFVDKNNLLYLNGKLKSISHKGGESFARKLKEDLEFKKEFSKISSNRLKQTHKKGKLRHDTFKGKTHTNETIHKMKDTHSKNKHQQGIKNSQYGKMWIYNLELKQNKTIKQSDIIPDGWVKGRKMKF